MKKFPLLLMIVSLAGCTDAPSTQKSAERQTIAPSLVAQTTTAAKSPSAQPSQTWLQRAQDASLPHRQRLAAAAMERLTHTVVYDPAYLRIPYPMGDVPATQGVCTDEIIRAYRTLGIDLQRLVHEDMRANFAKYPRRWGLTRPDTNIDHRRVPNLQMFFSRKGETRAMSRNGGDYGAGEIVTWMLPGNLPHIGIVTGRRSADGLRPLIVHNIGRGPQLEDMLFAYPITGRYLYPAS